MASDVPKFLNKKIVPDLEKLGLADLIPQLQEALIEEYKKDLPESEVYEVKDEDMYLYVPNFSEKEEDVSNKSENIGSDNQGKIKLDDFEDIDKIVTAIERQQTIENIKNEKIRDNEEKQHNNKENYINTPSEQ